MALLRIDVFILVCFCAVQWATSDLKIPDYGQIHVEFQLVEITKGLMKHNITEMAMGATLYPSGVLTIDGNFTVFKDTGRLQNALKYYKHNGKRFEPMFDTKSFNMCELSDLEGILKCLGKMDNHCGFKKGFKTLDLNATQIAHTIFGETFFYGLYRVYYSVYTNAGNVVAFITNVQLSPKTGPRPLIKFQSNLPITYV